jgi:isoleucyl-tRNA synthetase
MVQNRPDWCVSRQRPWGVGIPIFYGATSRQPVLDPIAIECVAKLVEEKGSDAWFTVPAADILPAGYAHPQTGETEFEKETDVLDVWFDSGSTSIAVLGGDVYPEWKENWPADLYLEGSDQHRGWFNSSLILGQAVNQSAPYKAVVTHGFVTDGDGRKMSKRLGNVIDPVHVCKQLGADVLRCWVAGTDYANDVPCTDAILAHFGEMYRNIRNTLRFLIGNLKGYHKDLAPANLAPLDTWIVARSNGLLGSCVDSYERFEFGEVLNRVHNFCRQELSAFYSDAIKDHMYCDGEDWESRRSTQAACYEVAKILIVLSAPILCHTAEESWRKLHETIGSQCESVHAVVFEKPGAAETNFDSAVAVVQEIKSMVSGAFELYKSESDVKNLKEVVLNLALPASSISLLSTFEPSALANFFKVSWVEITEGEPGVKFVPSPYLECARSRVRRPSVELVTLSGEEFPLSERDRKVLGV